MSDAAPRAAEPRTGTVIPFIDLAAQHEDIAAEIRESVDAVFAEQQFILGDRVTEFECDIAAYCDSLHAVACASGTDALLLSLTALDVGPGDEVITTPFTSFATAAAIRQAGATPVFVDVDPVTFNLDPNLVEAAVTRRTRAVIPVHLFGHCAEMEPLFRIAVRKRLSIIEDACQAIGATYHGRRAGVLGTLGCFSFFPTQNLGGAGDGGIITTDDAEIAERLRRLRAHGDAGGDVRREVGINSRLDALQAAVLSVKLKRLDEWNQARRENARRYQELFRHYELLDAVELPEQLPGCSHVYNRYVVRIRGGWRDAVRAHLTAQNIGTRADYAVPLHLQPAFAALAYSAGAFPEAESAAREVLSLPIFPELQSVHQEAVVRCVAAALGRRDHSSPTILSAGSRHAGREHRRAA
ncbi:MAG: DegT/DnrJ/EryC1/StrS family aminotransferase [Planctomycetaceae bacterium]